jgi:hypothetical protein
MNLSEIPLLRLRNQQLIAPKFTSVKEIVNWMGAMQAQDFLMVKWTVGIRLLGSTEKMINEAFNSGDILRTHLLRPTWHLVSRDDIGWMTSLTAPQIRTAARSRDRQLGLDEKIFSKSNTIIGNALAGGNHLSRESLVEKLRQVNIDTGDNRASHILLRAETEGIICSGRINGNKLTYALLSERVGKTGQLSREEALARLALRYFTSHGPATLADFTWWSGLPAGEAKKALESVKSKLLQKDAEGQTYWLSPLTETAKPGNGTIHLLPAFDEYIISYRDRTAALPLVHNKKAVSNNGIFYPVILQNGLVTGTWSKSTKNGSVTLELKPFNPSDKHFRKKILEIVSQYENYLEKKVIFNL